MAKDVFLGYVMNADGEWVTAVELRGALEVWYFAARHRSGFYEIRVTDLDDAIVFQVVGGELVFPKEPDAQRGWRRICSDPGVLARLAAEIAQERRRVLDRPPGAEFLRREAAAGGGT